jgi:flotillin
LAVTYAHEYKYIPSSLPSRTDEISFYSYTTATTLFASKPFAVIKMRYTVAKPNAYLAITDLGIEAVLIKKKAFIYLLQKVLRFSITPFDFSMRLEAMTQEKMKFWLPAVSTIGPEDNNETILKYAVLLTGNEDSTAGRGMVAVGQGRQHVQELV